MTERVFAPPVRAEGQGVAAALDRALLVQKTTRGHANYDDSNPTDTLFEVPANCLVFDILVNVRTAFTANVTGTLGDGDDADGFMDAAAVALDATGFKSMRQDAQPYSAGKIYAAKDTIDLKIGGSTDPVAGAVDIYLVYLPLGGKA
jgi:hypothetical protein